MNYKKNSELKYSSIEASFIFSFILNSENSEVTNAIYDSLNNGTLLPGLPSIRKGWIPNFTIKSSVFGSKNIPNISCDFGHTYIPPDKEKKMSLLYKDENNETKKRKIVFSSITQLRLNGIGTWTAKIVLPENKSKDGEEPPLKYDFNDLTVLFNLMKTVWDRNSLVEIEFNKSKKIKLFNIFKQSLEDLLSNMNLTNIASIFPSENETGSVFLQNPYPLFACRISQNDYNEHFSNGLKVKSPIAKEIAAICSRTIFTNGHDTIDNTYMKKTFSYDSEYFTNNNLNSKFFVSTHPRACIAISQQFDDDLSKANLYSLILTLELFRMRWYSVVVLNVVLEENIRELDTNPIPSYFLEKVNNTRKKIASLFDDPCSYYFDGSAIGEIGEILEKQLNFKHLEEILYLKSKMLDRTCDDYLQVIHMKELEKRIKWRKD